MARTVSDVPVIVLNKLSKAIEGVSSFYKLYNSDANNATNILKTAIKLNINTMEKANNYINKLNSPVIDMLEVDMILAIMKHNNYSYHTSAQGGLGEIKTKTADERHIKLVVRSDSYERAYIIHEATYFAEHATLNAVYKVKKPMIKTPKNL